MAVEINLIRDNRVEVDWQRGIVSLAKDNNKIAI